jgi:hypothetical protein
MYKHCDFPDVEKFEDNKDDGQKNDDDCVTSDAPKKAHLSDSEEEEEEENSRPQSDNEGEESQTRKRSKQLHVLSDSDGGEDANEVSRKVSFHLVTKNDVVLRHVPCS